MGNPFPFVLADLRKSRGGVLAVVLLVALAVGLGVAVSAQERALRQGLRHGAALEIVGLLRGQDRWGA